MTKYQRGADLERRVKALLEGAGYFVVRSAGSHSVADLLALPRNSGPVFPPLSEALVVQCKRGGVLGPAEWNDLVRTAFSVSAVPVMARYSPRQPIEFFRLTGLKLARGRQPMEQIHFAETLTYPDEDVIIG